MWERHAAAAAVVDRSGRKDRCCTTADSCAASAERGRRRRLWMPGRGVSGVGRPSLVNDEMEGSFRLNRLKCRDEERHQRGCVRVFQIRLHQTRSGCRLDS